MLISDFQSGLSLAVALNNTYDALLEEPETLNTPQDLRSLLRAERFPIRALPTAGDVRKAKELRPHIYRVFASRTPRAKLTALNSLLQTSAPAPTVISAEDGYQVAFALPDDAGVVERIAGVSALGLADVVARYGPERLKVCEASPCQNAFVDFSKNQVGRYCSKLCANRENAAVYRRRRRRGPR